MKLIRNVVEPVEGPEPGSGRLIGDPQLEAQVQVFIGGVTFFFERGETGDWRRAGCFTAARGHGVDARWLAVAQKEADRVICAEIEKAGGEEQVSDTAPCPDCGKVLCHPQISTRGKVVSVDCGPAHTVHFEDGRLELEPGGEGVFHAA